jgi:2-(1,2-epoxy-1,2-dihydrophenyl)acetyl-CoA isomerase
LAETVTLTRENQVAVLTLNRPEHMNALNKEMTSQLEDLIVKIKKDPYIRVVVLRGAGEVFMAGSDLYEVYKELDTTSSDGVHLVRQFNAATLALREMEKIVIASVHGLVAGQGMSLMLAADLVVASEGTRFSVGYCNIATSPAGGISYRLPRLVGGKKAMELLLLSEMFDAEEAADLGLINWVVPKDELINYVNQLVDRIVNGPTLAFTQTKQLINSAWQAKLSAQLELEAESFTKTINSRDFKSAVRAFVNKRQPEFEGR